MERKNLFEALADDLPSDDGNISEEADITDDEEWIPTQAEADMADKSETEIESEDEQDAVYTDLVPVAPTMTMPREQNNTETIEQTANREIDEHSESARIILGKDKLTQWLTTAFSEGRTPSKNIVKIPKNRIPNTNNVVSPTDAFLLFVDDNITKTIVDNTNIEGTREKGSTWKDTDSVEIKAFIGCLLHCGALRQSNMSVEMLFSPVDGNSLVRAAFGMHRFSNLLNHIRFDDKETRTIRRARDLFAPVRDVWNRFQDNLARYYVPGESITIDEQLVPFRGRCSFIQYIPSKPDKYGIKIFWACDASNNYPLRAEPYLGKDTTSAKPSQRTQSVAANVVTSLTDDFHGSGRNITTDNYFTELKLAEHLAKKKLTTVGTVRRNKTFLPREFQEKKALPLGDSRFLFRKETVLVSFQTKRQKNVLLLSTMHNKGDVCGETKKPEIVLSYNKTKGGVDAMDQMAHAFTTKRKTKRWPLVIFFNILDLSSIAALVVFRIKYPMDDLCHEDNRQRFNIDIGRSLALPQIIRRSTIPTLQKPVQNNIQTVLETLRPSTSIESVSSPPAKRAKHSDGKRKRCDKCPTKKDKKTKTTCSKCSAYICPEHSVVCCQNCA